MNDADRLADVSLETDRLEQLLEVPAPAQPVVMIEYRNRGVPWWLLVSLIVLVPLVAVIAYQQLVVQRYQDQAAKARYLAQVLETKQSADERPKPEPATVEPLAANAASVVISAQVAPAPVVQPPPLPAASDEVKAQPTPPETASEAALAGAAKPPEARVRSVFPTPLEPAVTDAAPKGAAAGSIGPASGSPVPAARDDSVKTQVAGPEQPRAGAAVAQGDGTPAGDLDRAALAPDAGPNPFEPAGGPDAVPKLAPLPTREEMRTQIAEESAKMSAEGAEALAIANDRMRVRRYEDRIQFHAELRQILARDVREAGTEIDALTKRKRGDSDIRARAKANVIWRNKNVPLATRVGQIRSLGISESDILDLMSDNLYARMRAPGGPRDNNEVRVRAARLLLSCELSGGNGAPEAGAAPGSAPKRSRTVADSPR